jgi:hypothetical protein
VFDDVPDEPDVNQGDVSNEENDPSLPNTPVEVMLDYTTSRMEGRLNAYNIWTHGL